MPETEADAETVVRARAGLQRPETPTEAVRDSGFGCGFGLRFHFWQGA